MRRLLVSLFAASALFACSEQQARTNSSSGTLALTHDDALLYAVDGDNQFVSVIDAQKQERIATVKVGAQPEQILILPDDSAYVANRGDRSLSFFKRGDWENVERIAVGVEPVGLALSKDGKQLLVVNEASLVNSEKGSLMAIDVASNQIKWELEVGQDPRAITVLSDTRALVSLYRPGDVVEVDLSVPKVTKAGTNLEADVNRVALNSGGGFPNDDPNFQKAGVKPRAISQLVASPEGDQVYGTVTWASTSVLNGGTPNSTGGGSTYGSSGGGCTGFGGGSVASAGIVTFKADSVTPQTDSLNECFGAEAKTYPATRLQSPNNNDAIQGPSAMIVDATGSWLFVANSESNNVAIVPTTRGTNVANSKGDFFAINSGVKDLVTVGAFPTGLALSSDGKRLFVQNQFDHTVQVLESRGAASDSKIQPVGNPIKIADEVLSPSIASGRKLFFAANDGRMTGQNVGISCGSCHLDGREDGHVWNFAEGPRQTPSLAGRALKDTAPYHWGGEHPTFDSFLNHTVNTRMGGTGSFPHDQLFAFINAMPTPDNPNHLAAPSDAQVRGAQVFQKAGCNTCHAGATYSSETDADVGTFVRSGTVQDDLTFLSRGLNTPSLLGLSRTAPYLHDGSARTIKDRILQGKAFNKHGQTAQLTDVEVDDLVEFLKSL